MPMTYLDCSHHIVAISIDKPLQAPSQALWTTAEASKNTETGSYETPSQLSITGSVDLGCDGHRASGKRQDSLEDECLC
jgi:hypothetical protein